MSPNQIKITVITATYNSEEYLDNLISSILNQTDKNFYWQIQDGASKDSTVTKIKKTNFANLKIFVQNDRGIYDAYNKAVKNCSTEYCLFVGSDDYLDLNAIKNFRKCLIYESPDLIATKWYVDKKLYRPYKKLGWLKGLHGISSSHSVATLIKTNLHEKFGYYSLNFPICADALFIKKCIYSGSTIKYCNFISGTFTTGGHSSKNIFKTLKEAYIIQTLTEKFLFFQKILYLIKLLKVKILVR